MRSLIAERDGRKIRGCSCDYICSVLQLHFASKAFSRKPRDLYGGKQLLQVRRTAATERSSPLLSQDFTVHSAR